MTETTLAAALADIERRETQWSQPDFHLFADHPHVDPGDTRKECPTCHKWVHQANHSCKGVDIRRQCIGCWVLDVLRGDREVLGRHVPTGRTGALCHRCDWSTPWPCPDVTRVLDRYLPVSP